MATKTVKKEKTTKRAKKDDATIQLENDITQEPETTVVTETAAVSVPDKSEVVEETKIVNEVPTSDSTAEVGTVPKAKTRATKAKIIKGTTDASDSADATKNSKSIKTVKSTKVTKSEEPTITKSAETAIERQTRTHKDHKNSLGQGQGQGQGQGPGPGNSFIKFDAKEVKKCEQNKFEDLSNLQILKVLINRGDEQMNFILKKEINKIYAKLDNDFIGDEQFNYAVNFEEFSLLQFDRDVSRQEESIMVSEMDNAMVFRSMITRGEDQMNKLLTREFKKLYLQLNGIPFKTHRQYPTSKKDRDLDRGRDREHDRRGRGRGTYQDPSFSGNRRFYQGRNPNSGPGPSPSPGPSQRQGTAPRKPRSRQSECL